MLSLSAALGLWLAGPLLQRRLPPPALRRLQRWGGACLCLALVVELAGMYGHGASLLASGADVSVSQIVKASTRSQVGALLWAQAALTLLALLLAIALRNGALVAAALFGAVACTGASGHVASGGESMLLSGVAIAHVGLVGLWLGGLPVLWMLCKPGRLRPSTDTAVDTLAAFSRVALPAMALILASGVLLAMHTVGSWAALVATPYGRMLLVKLALLGLVLSCAFVLRRALVRRDPRLVGARPLAHRWLTREGVLACGVVAAAGTLAGWIPGVHDRIDWPFGFRVAPQAAWMQRQDRLPWPLAGAAVLTVLGWGVAAATWQRHRRFALLAGIGASASGLALAMPALTVAAYPSTYSASVAPYDSTSVVAGARLYGSLCAQCHGVHGHGDGALAAGLTPAPADLTAPHLGWHTHGDMYWWLTHGFEGSAMPGFASRTTETQRWELVNHLMALSLGYQARSVGERPVAGERWLAAINFRYAAADGGYAQLDELQQHAPVLLVFINTEAEMARLAGLSAEVQGLAGAGLKVIAVLAPHLHTPATPSGTELVSDADGAILEAWSNYRRTLAQPDFRDEHPAPSRLEFLLDRAGYVRARWRADEGARAPDTQALRAALHVLAREPDIPSADVHAH